MRSHGRTLLARLGFADPDRKNPVHDLACAYLCQPEVADKVREAARVAYPKVPDAGDAKLEKTWITSESEVHLQKGEGQYAQTVGFLDVVLSFHANWVVPEPSRPGYGYRESSSPKRVAVEVKASRETAGDVLRQMNVYRSYYRWRTACGSWAEPAGWVLATLYDLTEVEHQAFTNARITCVRIGGPKFEEFLAKAKSSRATDVPEL